MKTTFRYHRDGTVTKRTVAQAKREARARTQNLLWKVRTVLREVAALPSYIDEYETTGDHDHGQGPIRGTPCPGGDCLVHEARELLRKLASDPAVVREEARAEAFGEAIHCVAPIGHIERDVAFMRRVKFRKGRDRDNAIAAELRAIANQKRGAP